MINKKDFYYIFCILINIWAILIINDKVEFKLNKYLEMGFFALLILLNEIDIKFSVLLSFIYISLKLKNN